MIFLIGLGGIAGALARFYFGKWVVARKPTMFPLGTLIINSTGSFLLGMLFSLQTHNELPHDLWLILGVGFCGAYTTFSTFGYETLLLIEKRKIGFALAYVVFSILFGLLFAWLGFGLHS